MFIIYLCIIIILVLSIPSFLILIATISNYITRLSLNFKYRDKFKVGDCYINLLPSKKYSSYYKIIVKKINGVKCKDVETGKIHYFDYIDIILYLEENIWKPISNKKVKIKN